MHTHTYTHTHTHTYTHSAHTHTHMHACTHTHAHTRMHTHACTHTCTTRMHTHTTPRMHACAHTHTTPHHACKQSQASMSYYSRPLTLLFFPAPIVSSLVACHWLCGREEWSKYDWLTHCVEAKFRVLSDSRYVCMDSQLNKPVITAGHVHMLRQLVRMLLISCYLGNHKNVYNLLPRQHVRMLLLLPK